MKKGQTISSFCRIHYIVCCWHTRIPLSSFSHTRNTTIYQLTLSMAHTHSIEAHIQTDFNRDAKSCCKQPTAKQDTFLGRKQGTMLKGGHNRQNNEINKVKNKYTHIQHLHTHTHTHTKRRNIETVSVLALVQAFTSRASHELFPAIILLPRGKM